jgi:hypothetical protein
MSVQVIKDELYLNKNSINTLNILEGTTSINGSP